MALEHATTATREGRLDEALAQLQDCVRKEPSNAALRVFLFQLLCVNGQWARALTQLDVAAELDPKHLPMAQMYREAIRCEMVRAQVFGGQTAPLIFGEPEPWLAMLVESLLVAPTSRAAEAESLRARAFEDAPAVPGTIDGQPFEWLGDADPRLGPVCEAIINGRYYWVPYARLSALELEAPTDLRDVVWMPAHFHFSNGGEVVGVVPTRYPGTESDADPLFRLARRTDWVDAGGGLSVGRGQRLLATNAEEYALMNVRSIVFGEPSGGAADDTHA